MKGALAGKIAQRVGRCPVHVAAAELLAPAALGRGDHAGAHAVRIQYGGSVKASNARELFTQPGVDGGLIGGASLKADEFCAIVRAAAPATLNPT